MIVIIDYNMGNVRSVLKALKKIGVNAVVSSESDVIEKADKLILPGVGSFAEGMRNLTKRNLIPVLEKKVLEDKTPILGICLGMQLFSRHSEEGDAKGLGWIEADTKKFQFTQDQDLRIPHVGWNIIRIQKEHSLLQGIPNESRFYFTHSYHIVCDNPQDILAQTPYGGPFVSIVQKDHIIGTQFHPETSHQSGMYILRNFLESEAAPKEMLSDIRINTRIFPCLLLKGEGLVKTTKFKNPVYIGDPINAVRIYNTKEVDELVFLDITATVKQKKPQIDLIKKISDECSMPLTVGGGITSIDDIRALLKAGAEKVAVNTYAIEHPKLITEASQSFGSQAIIAAIDVKKNWMGKYEVMAEGGHKKTGLDPVNHAIAMQQAGAGEILLYSVDRDGTMQGYDIELIKKVTQAVDIPVIASGGAGQVADFAKAVHQGGASAVTAGSFFVFHGPRRAVLINFPQREELETAFKNN